MEAYNKVIDDFKHDLSVQKKVWDAISNLDRPYKRGVRGVDTNLYEDGPQKPELQDLGFPRQEKNPEFDFDHPTNADRFISETIFHRKHEYKHWLEWEEERRNRPVTRDYNHGKGYKYDIAFTEEEKFDYVSDRLGHQEFVGHPIDRLFRLEKDIFHPTYLDQPFVKMPSAKPSEKLNFELGEVVYENTRVLEWLKFWQTTVLAGGAVLGIFVPFNLAFKTNLITGVAD